MEDLYNEYEPLKWPPDMRLAELHLKCSRPGKENVEGAECPCCGRYEKMKVRNWFKRDIIKDFKSYGGGIPAYFQLMKYCGASLIILAIIIVFFHIYCLETVCNSPYAKCPTFLRIFRFCDANTIYEGLKKLGKGTIAEVFFWLQLGSFIYLIIATIGMKWFMQYINSKKIIKEDKIYGQFSLMIKNIPLFYQIDDVRKEIYDIVPGAEICELFFVHEIANLQIKYKRLFDLHYQIQFLQQNIIQSRGGSEEELQALKEQYVKLFEGVQEEKKKLYTNNGRAIIVFNSMVDRQIVYKKLQIGECEKFTYQVKRLLGKSTRKLHFFADKVSEPQEILWNYIGESSESKTKVRIETTLVGVGFMIICFLVLYFPIVYSDEAKIKERNGFGAYLSIIIALIIQILSIVYRLFILKLIPSRQPSSREAESYFIVMTTVIYHFLFYLVAPASYFLFAYKIPNSVKLLQLFVNIMMFLFFTTIIALIDVRYRIFNSRRKKILSSWAFWGKFCQIRLHEQIRWPSFPIEFKLMIALKIWAFNAFYIFQIPYILFMFVIVIFIIFWNDKKNIYKHYKMQVYLSIDVELSVLRDYTFIFLICVCAGYAISVIHTWQYIFIGVIFVFSIILNVMLTFQAKFQREELIRTNKALTLAQIIKTSTNNPKQSMLHTIREAEMKENMFILESNASTVSIGSVAYQYGYKDTYDSFLMHFKNKTVLKVLEDTFYLYKNKDESSSMPTASKSMSHRKLSKESQMQNFNHTGKDLKKDDASVNQNESQISREVDEQESKKQSPESPLPFSSGGSQ